MTAQEAIEYIRSCRDTHVDAVNFYDQGFTAQDWLGDEDPENALGSKKFHQDCIDEYNEVIQALEEALYERTDT